MLYRDLVQFDPIESIVILRQASNQERARELVRTYVTSDRMADRLTDLVLPQLDLDRPRDNRGVLIVGNYGTGKSHLMSVLAALAEFPELVDDLSNLQVAQSARRIAGRFKVLRVEIGAVERNLRDIILDELEGALEDWGTPYHFPASTEVNNNKDILIEAVAAFQQKYPGQGILLVVDELLDYLRGRQQERALILDLGFLRELGEVSGETAFRFIGGLQETLFDSPHFAFVAAQLGRVRDRFEQVLIAREDIAYVISHRLLKKDDRQKAIIREHLRQFEPLYGSLSERMDEFVALFPIHPAYIQAFQDMFIAEKRQVLLTFSQAMASRLDAPVPTDEPGILSFDHYWGILQENPSIRSISEVAEVIDKSSVLEGLVRNGYSRKQLLPMAQRIIHALSVHRLTTDDINVPVGLTAEALRDSLFLYQRMPEATAEFLLMQVQFALREIMRTVQGQFLSYNEANGQYYIDVKKSVDFDAQIQTRADMLSTDVLNRYFFEALAQTMGLSATTYVTNYRIWFYELPWASRRVTRPGYLFLGLPTERSTAQPPRDFYIYVIPPFKPGEWLDQENPDEIIFRLQGTDETFKRLVSLYAGARDLATTSAQHRSEYADKADGYRRQLVNWLRDNLLQYLQVTFQGNTRPVRAILAETRSTASESIREVLDIAAAHCLEPTFEETYPDHPAFSRATATITEEARNNTAMQAVRALAGLRRTALAEVVLDGLRLLDAQGEVRPYDSPYARHLLALLEAKAEGQVVNRGEVIEIIAGGVDRPIEKDVRFHLEPEWIAVVMAALIYTGDIEGTYGSKKIDAGSIRELATMSMEALTDFRHYGRPPSVPVGRWGDIFQTLGLQPGLIRNENDRAQGVRELQRVVGAELEHITQLEHRVSQGLRLWNSPVFTDNLNIQSRDGMVIGSDLPDVHYGQTDVLPHLRAYKRLLEALQPFDTVGKLRNLRIAPETVADAAQGREVAARIERLMALIDQLQERAAYLAGAAPNLPQDHPLQVELAEARANLLVDLRKMGRGDVPVTPGAWASRLEELKQRYIADYAASHRRLVLGPVEDEQRESIYRSAPLRQLLELDRLHLLPSGDLQAWKTRLTSLRTCPQFHEGLLEQEPTCPHCHLNPAAVPSVTDARTTLRALEEQLHELLADWQQAVISALGTEVAQRSLEAMTPAEKAVIRAFLEHPDAPALPSGFVDAANKALQGIESLPLSVEALVSALREGGLPCTVAEFRARFSRFVDGAMRGHDEQNTRLTLNT